METSPLVSIIIPCYNRQKYISDAINSCLRQSYQNIEIIVVDDGSSDESISVIKSFGQKVKLICQANQGVSVARNKGIEACTGEYLIFLDSDDWISDDLVESHILTFKHWPDLAIACADSIGISPTGQQTELRKCNWPESPSSPKDLFLLIPPPFPACEMYNAELVKRYGGFYEDMKAFADSSLRIRIVLDGGFVARTPTGYAIYRPVENSITKNREKIHQYALVLLSKLKKEYSGSTEILSLLEQRLKKHRLRYWFSTFSYHLSMKPNELIKFVWHLLNISRLDKGYLKFIITQKPWRCSKKEAF